MERAKSTMWERLAWPLTGMSAAAFAGLAALRRNRVFHPVGHAYTARLTIDSPRDLHLPAGTIDALVRFSRGGGLPEPLPDVLGLAVKFSRRGGADQDLLLASSGKLPVARNLLLPVRGFFRCTYSSVLPYRVEGEQILFGARADPRLRNHKGDFGDLQEAMKDGAVAFEILAAGLTGPWEQIGTLILQETCDQETSRSLRFNPWNSDPALVPAGPLNVLRRSAYRGSQSARPD